MLIPEPYQIQSVSTDTADVFTLVLANSNGKSSANFMPGQFNMLYHFGCGEAAISISGHPKFPQQVVHTIRAVGSVTKNLQTLQPGDEIGVRGPFGSFWPLERKFRHVLVIAGGIGLAALRSALLTLSDNFKDYQSITLLYGTRKSEDILYRQDLESWKRQGMQVEITLDYADKHWPGHVGVVTSLIKAHVQHPKDTLVLICGPEIMMRFALHELLAAQVDEDNIYISMERHMQCAVAFCGHCQLGPYFLCKDGPVFSYTQIKDYFYIKEL